MPPKFLDHFMHTYVLITVKIIIRVIGEVLGRWGCTCNLSEVMTNYKIKKTQ